jgi:hypothetical protein
VEQADGVGQFIDGRRVFGGGPGCGEGAEFGLGDVAL